MDAGEAQLANGDPAFRMDFVEFYRRQLGGVIGLAFVLSGSRSGAEELAQEAFLSAFRVWHRIAHYNDPGAWVRRVVANAAVSRFRRMRAEARAVFRLDHAMYVIPEGDADADRLWAEVRALSSRQAQVIALHYLDERTTVEIGEILGISEPTVKTHLQRGRQALAQRLGAEER